MAEGGQAEAEAVKAQANALVADEKYDQAIEKYTEALNLWKSAVYYANRAFCHIQLENLGSAIQDATEAIKLDPRYAKGWYRRAWSGNSDSL